LSDTKIGRHKERETQRERDTHTKRETHTKTGRHKEMETQRQGDTKRWRKETQERPIIPVRNRKSYFQVSIALL